MWFKWTKYSDQTNFETKVLYERNQGHWLVFRIRLTWTKYLGVAAFLRPKYQNSLVIKLYFLPFSPWSSSILIPFSPWSSPILIPFSPWSCYILIYFPWSSCIVVPYFSYFSLLIQNIHWFCYANQRSEPLYSVTWKITSGCHAPLWCHNAVFHVTTLIYVLYNSCQCFVHYFVPSPLKKQIIC